MMPFFLKRKKTLEKLYEKYENLRIEAFNLEKTDKEKSQELLREAKKVSEEIDRLKGELNINMFV